MKLIKQEEVDKAAENYGWRIKTNCFSDPVKANDLANSASIDFKAGVDYAEQEFSKLFPNEFESWYETFYEVVAKIVYSNEFVFPDPTPVRIKTAQEEQGIGGLYELAKELTDKFELLH